MSRPRPHVLGIDDGPFVKGQLEPVPIVAVMMEGADLVESVAVTRFPVDGDDATGFLGDWIGGLRTRSTLQAVILGGITIAGLGIVDVRALSAQLALPVLVVNRREPTSQDLEHALRSAGLADRAEALHATPPAERVQDGLYLAHAGTDPERAKALTCATLGKAQLPEPLRIAHLIAAALMSGESRGRV